MAKKKQIKIVKIPLKNKTENDKPQNFPVMPRLYLELIENKAKIKQDLVNKEYIPSKNKNYSDKYTDKNYDKKPKSYPSVDLKKHDRPRSDNTISENGKPESAGSLKSNSTHIYEKNNDENNDENNDDDKSLDDDKSIIDNKKESKYEPKYDSDSDIENDLDKYSDNEHGNDHNDDNNDDDRDNDKHDDSDHDDGYDDRQHDSDHDDRQHDSDHDDRQHDSDHDDRESDILSSRLKELLDDDERSERSEHRNKRSDTPRDTYRNTHRENRNTYKNMDDVQPDKYSKLRNSPPTLAELEAQGVHKMKRELRNIDNISMSEIEEEDAKRELLFKYELLKKSYPTFTIPEFTLHSDYKFMKKTYDMTLRQLSIDSSHQDNRKYLIYGFVLVELVLGQVFKLKMQGFASYQASNISVYDKLLIELGEKSYIPTGSSWPVEVRLVGMIIMQAALFLATKMLFDKTGANILDIISNLGKHKLDNTNNIPRPKKKMKGPDINLNDISDFESVSGQPIV